MMEELVGRGVMLELFSLTVDLVTRVAGLRRALGERRFGGFATATAIDYPLNRDLAQQLGISLALAGKPLFATVKIPTRPTAQLLAAVCNTDTAAYTKALNPPNTMQSKTSARTSCKAGAVQTPNEGPLCANSDSSATAHMPVRANNSSGTNYCNTVS